MKYQLIENKREAIGIAIICIGIIGFFYFGFKAEMFGSKINYFNDPIVKHTPWLSLILGFYGIGYIRSHKAGLHTATTWAFVLLGAYIIGFLKNVVF